MEGADPGARSPASVGPVPRVVSAILLTAVAAILAYQLSLVPTRTFDADEFQHTHSAFEISRGRVPYRDYFEHHPPLLHALMSPVIKALHPEGSGEAAFQTLFCLRVLGWATGVLGGLAHYMLARRLLGGLGGAVASLLFWSTLIVFEKTIEVRPDTGAFALLQVALLLSSREGSFRRTATVFLILGVGLLFTQKLAFPILGVLAATCLAPVASSTRLRRLAVASLCLLAPTAFCAAAFLLMGGLASFVEDVFLINLRWKARLAAWPFFVTQFLERNPLFAVLGGLGLVQAAVTRAEWAAGGAGAQRMVLWSAITGLLGLALLPVAWDQYYLFFLPQAAILGAAALLRGVSSVSRQPPMSAAVAIAVLCALLLSLSHSKDLILAQRLRTSESKQAAIAMILDNSSPTETVLDGYSGIGVFRPHAFRYFFLHAEMRQMLEPAEILELENGLLSGTIAPRFASGDSQLRAVSPRVREFLDQNFATVGDGPAQVRLFPGGVEGWDDHAVRFFGEPLPPNGPFVLAVSGWSGRRSQGGRTFRTSRGKISTLLFSVLDPGSIRTLALSARAGTYVPGLRAAVRLNGTDLGDLALGESVAVVELSLPQGVLVRGVNRLEFVYLSRPAQLREGLTADENATLALESLTLKP